MKSGLTNCQRVVCLLCMGWALTTGVKGATVDDDEHIIFFPSYASRDADGTVWKVHIHGWIFQPEADSLKRAAALSLVRRSLGIEKGTAEQQRLYEILRAFLVDNKRGKQLSIRLGNEIYPLGMSQPNGHIEATFSVPEEKVKQWITEPEKQAGWVAFSVVLPEGDQRMFNGKVQFIEPQGISVISDIDDTIKISEVLDKKALLKNTFLHEYRAAPGMAAGYGQWVKQNWAFHYVSGSPWQLYEPLNAFRHAASLPEGTWQLRHFRLKDSSLLEMFDTPENYKLTAIEPLLKAFPQRRIILVGDSGERDPEVYGTLARQYPKQISHIFIRQVTPDDRSSARYQTAFADLPDSRWSLFTDGQDLSRFLP